MEVLGQDRAACKSLRGREVCVPLVDGVVPRGGLSSQSAQNARISLLDQSFS